MSQETQVSPPDLEWAHARLSRQDFASLSAFIYQHSGLRYPPVKRLMLEGRLRKRLRALGLATFAEYCARIVGPAAAADEIVRMIDAATTNKTDFFRESAHFDYLVDDALPALMEAGGAGCDRPLAVWSVACSSGEEVYTLAMVLETVSQAGPRLRYSILGTDICTSVLDVARQGIYDQKLIEPIPGAMRRRFLLQSRARDRELVRIAPVLRARVRFSHLNLLAPFNVRGRPDIVFCRNVLIYFDRADQTQVLERLCELLTPGGYLFLGHSDTITGLRLPLIPLVPSIYRKRETR